MKNQITLLGVTLNSTLTMETHITAVAKDCSAKANMLYKLTKCTKLNSKSLRKLYRAYIEPKMCYAAPVLANAAQYHKRKLQVAQNKALSICFGLPKGFSIKQMHEIAKMPLVNDRLNQLATQWYTKAKQNNIHNFRQIEQVGTRIARQPPLHYLEEISKTLSH